ncbi:hypothetical protein OQA88_2131 [Cercophora sp. LCS_1]
MKTFEHQLAQATVPAIRGILGAIGLVLDRKGDTLYHHAAGHQSLEPDGPPLDPDSTVALGSAGKFITHIAALQHVERGAVNLDDPIENHLPELGSLPLIVRSDGNTPPFKLQVPTNKITLRHLLLHASGLASSDDPVIRAYLDTNPAPLHSPNTESGIIKNFSLPLVFEPGDGFAYGCSIHWTQLLVGRLAAKEGSNFLDHVQTNIFEPLRMTSSTYMPRDHPSIWDRRLRMVEREQPSSTLLVPADDATQGLVCSITDVGKILTDLISPSSKLLKRRDLIDLLFEGQLTGKALDGLRGEQDNFEWSAGRVASGDGPPPVNWSAGGLVLEGGSQELWGIPEGTLTWEGMPNVHWAVHREKGLALFFATQLIPFGDPKAHKLAQVFMKEAWTTFS